MTRVTASEMRTYPEERLEAGERCPSLFLVGVHIIQGGNVLVGYRDPSASGC